MVTTVYGIEDYFEPYMPNFCIMNISQIPYFTATYQQIVALNN